MNGVLHVGTRKGLFTLVREPAGWHIAATDFLGDPVTMLLGDPRDGTLYAALDHGHFGVKLHRREADAEAWQEIAVPVYPPLAEGEEPVVNPFTRQPIPQKLIRIWSLEAGGPDQAGRLWCGTMPGGLFRSDDRGDTWDLVRGLWDHPGRRSWMGGGADYPGLHSICVDPRDPDRIVVGVSCGGCWLTTDGGETWEPRSEGMWSAYTPPDQKHDPLTQDPHRVVQCRAAPDVYWAQHHNAVFRSTDGAETWEDIASVEPSVFGFPVAVHPDEPDTAWFVPAIKDEQRYPVDGQVVVARTRDGGRSFQVLREGLPQEHAYDLVYRHALDIDSTGDRLAFGSTTGSLWITENQGNHWATVSNHLPPILVVRFPHPASS